MATSAYIYTLPSLVQFSLPYSDGGEKFRVQRDSSKPDFWLHQESDKIICEVKDIEWLIQSLEDLKKLIDMKDEIQKKLNPKP